MRLWEVTNYVFFLSLPASSSLVSSAPSSPEPSNEIQFIEGEPFHHRCTFSCTLSSHTRVSAASARFPLPLTAHPILPESLTACLFPNNPLNLDVPFHHSWPLQATAARLQPYQGLMLAC